MPSTITALVLLGATVLPDGTDAAIPNGWVARATLPDDGASTFDPTKITLQVADPGFDSAGNTLLAGLGGPVRTITGTVRVRKQYPNNAQKLDSANAGTRTVHFALSDFIYASTVINSADAAAGYYGAAASGSIAGVDKSAVTKTYQRPQFAFLNLPGERSGATFNVEAVAFSPYMRSGRQVAAIKYQGKEGANTTPIVTATYGLSAVVTNGNIPEAYKATLDCANLTQGSLCTVDAWIYPFMGDAPFQLSVHGVAWPTHEPFTPLRFVCDKAATWGGNTIYVAPATAVPAGVDTNAGTTGAPVATILKALQLVQAKNNAAPTAPTHNDIDGGRVLLKDLNGAPATFDPGDLSTVPVGGKGYCTISPDPANTSTATVDINGSRMFHAGWLRFTGPVKERGWWAAGTGAVGAPIMIDGGTLDDSAQGSGVPFTYQSLGYFRNINGGSINVSFGTFGTVLSGCAAIIGCTNTGFSHGNAAVRIGNRFVGGNMDVDPPAANTGQPNFAEGAIIYNNRLLRQNATNNLCTSRQSLKGVALIQNVFEPVFIGPVWKFGGDDTPFNFLNGLVAYNVIPDNELAGTGASRFNHWYMDAAGDVGKQKEGFALFNAFVNANMKADPFVGKTTLTGRTGNWTTRHKVGWLGNVIASGQDNSTGPTGDGVGWIGDGWGPGAVTGTGVLPTFVSNLSGSGQAGNGDYHPATSEPNLVNKVPAGRAGLSYDLGGAQRYNNGYGAAGAYERTDPIPITGTASIVEANDTFSGSGALALRATASIVEGNDVISGGATLNTSGGPFTATGPIVAGADRIAVVDSSGNGAAWSATFDPSDRAPYAIDWTRILRDAETIVEIDKITMSAQGAALGVQVDQGSGRDPIISNDGKLTQFWFVVASSFQGDPAFSGSGVAVSLSVLIKSNAAPFEQFERTVTLTVRQQ